MGGTNPGKGVRQPIIWPKKWTEIGPTSLAPHRGLGLGLVVSAQGVSAQGGCLGGGVCLSIQEGVSAWGMFAQRVSAQGVLPEGVCLGCVCLPGVCLVTGGVCMGVSVQGVYMRGVCPRGCLHGGCLEDVWQAPPCEQNHGQV